MYEWIKELCPEIADWQAELIAEHITQKLEVEREECAKVVERMLSFYTQAVSGVPDAIRARGKE